MIYVAIGANLPSTWSVAPLDTCNHACALLNDIPGLSVQALSRWDETAPVPAGGQPRYVNGVAALSGAIDPAALLAALHGIEAAAGRIRSSPNVPRPLDLDIIAIDGLVRAAPDPILPHPRARLRAFVLLPLRDVAPAWVHPGSGHGIDALIAALPAADLDAANITLLPG